MALLTSSIIMKEFQREFQSMCKFAKACTTEYTDKFGEQSGDVAKGGTTISVKRPQMVSVRTGRAASFATPDEGSIPLTVDQFFGVDLAFNDTDLQLSVDDFSGRFIKSAAATLAAKVDSVAYTAAYKQFAKAVGTPGTTPTALKTFNQARGRLVDALIPEDGDINAIINTDCSIEIADSLKSLFNNQKEVSDTFLNGYLGRGAGLKWMEYSSVPVHTVGPQGGTPLVNGANQGIATGTAETTSLITDGWTASAASRLKAGDVITMAGVYDVDPLTKATRSYLKQFTVTADASSDGSGNLTAVISPAIIRAGAYQNVSAAPADNIGITVLGAANTLSPQNLVFHSKAVTLATIPLILPRGTDMAERTTSNGISMRLVRDWDNTNAALNTRVDVFFGVGVMRKEWGVRVFG